MATQQEIRDRLGVSIQVGDIIEVEKARIIWPNFAGARDQYNAEGDRNFNIHLTREQADDLTRDGWNVKCKYPRPDENTDEQEERCVLKITVNFDVKPPKIIGIGSKTRNRTEYHAGIAGLIDSAEIETCDISFVPYFWDVNGNVGVSAYLRSMYFVLREDRLDEKWAEAPEEATV